MESETKWLIGMPPADSFIADQPDSAPRSRGGEPVSSDYGSACWQPNNRLADDVFPPLFRNERPLMCCTDGWEMDASVRESGMWETMY